MYLLLFNVGSVAIAGWLLMIFLPAWSVTKWIARSMVFPAFLAALYVVGLVALLQSLGWATVMEFASAAGVQRLLAMPDVALVIWIHVLAFDHAVGIFIYRDNMRERVIPLPVQSIILIMTLVFGPSGFLLYYVLRAVRKPGPALGDAGWNASVG